MGYTQFFTLIFIIFPLTAYSQKHTGKIFGKVTASEIPQSGVIVFLENTGYFSETDDKGFFSINAPAGTYQMVCSSWGYQTQKLEITLAENASEEINIKLLPIDQILLKEVAIMGKSAIQSVKETPYNVVALDAKSLYNSTADLGHMLNKASGVKIRETGGMGSRMNISLNGFTGRNVKLFMDGVPMQGFGSAFQLNNIPVSIADRIEVYKGVVPIEFGADAMGGVINIVTNQSTNTFVDASYSHGSFNTHRANIIAGHTNRHGLSVQLNAFLNYSDNNYKVFLDKMLDVNTGSYIPGKYKVRRFHDKYENQTLMVKIGFVKRRWADRFFIGLTTGKLDADIQNASTLAIAYGARTRASRTLLPSVEYYKRNFIAKNLTFRFTGNYNINSNQNVDTVARLYNWYGEYMPTRTRGESGTNTLSDFKNENFSSTANLSYLLNDHHSFTINDVLSGYERKLSANVPPDLLASPTDTMRRASSKNVLGASYSYRPDEKWNVNLFGKHYYQHITGPVDTTTTNESKYAEQARSFRTSGYGIAASHFINDYQLKASAEQAYRLPAESELFGDEVLATGNTSLRAENSMNINLGLTLNKHLSDSNVLYLDFSTYYRLTRDFIQQVQNPRYGTIGNVNFGHVRNIGLDAETRYYYKNKFMIGGTVTYMDLRNRERLRDAQSTVNVATYNNRMPNIPYFFGNTDVAYYLHDLYGKGNVLSFNYTCNYVGEFYLLWESQGDKNKKATLPRQLYHDFLVTYSIKNGTYNMSLEALNFTNAILYDNFSLQKPGRSFNVKLRYYFNKRS